MGLLLSERPFLTAATELSGAVRGRTEVEVIVKHEARDKNLFSHVCHSWAQIPTHTHTPLTEKSYFMSFNAFLTLTS